MLAVCELVVPLCLQLMTYANLTEARKERPAMDKVKIAIVRDFVEE